MITITIDISNLEEMERKEEDATLEFSAFK